jgi:2-polyprenyl-3-methyl-5-hydroxy-6-metoxy-1,4-benzoquinol methylase
MYQRPSPNQKRSSSEDRPYRKSSPKPGPTYIRGEQQKKEVPRPVFKASSQSTSWGNVADWYDEYLKDADSYQSQVILPNIERMLALTTGERVLDIGCGQGFFSESFARKGAQVTAVDISPELINKAEQRKEFIGKKDQFLARALKYIVSPAEKISEALGSQSSKDGKSTKFDAIVSILAMQNMSELERVFAECSQQIKGHGRMVIVLNHPAFRVPQYSDWTYDEKINVQGRVTWKYLSEAKIKIDMHPGYSKEVHTWSFHRPLQVYMKWLSKYGFAITRIEEWSSHKKTATGPRASAENNARKEIPLFMALECRLIDRN